MEKVIKTLRELAEAALADEKLFIVDLTISTSRTPKVTVLIDGDEGVTIDDCSRISREIGQAIEETDAISSSYTLDVGSPGLDTPLMLVRQYKKNIGRQLKVKLKEGKALKGKLIDANDDGITLKLGKKDKEESKKIEFTEIEWAKVQVSFNNI